MDFKWIQLRSSIGEMQKWGLFHKDTKRMVLIVQLSNHGSQKENCKIRRKIMNDYNRYYNKVLFESFQFFK